MSPSMEYLTTTEAALAAGVSVPQIHRIIDERILPDDLYETSEKRAFRSDACILIAFYFDTANVLTKDARLHAIEDARTRCTTWSQWERCVFEEHAVSVHFSEWSKSVNARLDQLRKAREMVVLDPEILNGTPVIKGTRVPVHQIAAIVDAGTPREKILNSYPSVKDWQLELASVYAKAVPLRGRPKRSLPPGSQIKSVVRKRLPRSSSGE